MAHSPTSRTEKEWTMRVEVQRNLASGKPIAAIIFLDGKGWRHSDGSRGNRAALKAFVSMMYDLPLNRVKCQATIGFTT